jgi:hypothetical protein
VVRLLRRLFGLLDAAICSTRNASKITSTSKFRRFHFLEFSFMTFFEHRNAENNQAKPANQRIPTRCPLCMNDKLDIFKLHMNLENGIIELMASFKCLDNLWLF